MYLKYSQLLLYRTRLYRNSHIQWMLYDNERNHKSQAIEFFVIATDIKQEPMQYISRQPRNKS